MLILLAVLSVVGAALYGSARWFDTGVILIQPSELAKIVMILVLADYFTRHQSQMHEFKWVVRSFLLTMGMVVWILIQPNLSTSIVILVIWLYNGLVQAGARTQEAWSGISAQLKRRTGLVPYLVCAIKGYAAHERQLLDEVARRRAEAGRAPGPAIAGQADLALGAALERLLAVAPR